MNDKTINELKQQLWDATDYGRRFFEDEFSSEIAKNLGKIKGFAVRPNDKTGSCHLHQKGNNPYTFTDFGVSGKGKNAIDYVCDRDNVSFWEALVKLLRQYNISVPKGAKLEPKTEFIYDTDLPAGAWKVAFYEQIKNTSVARRLFPFYTDELLAEYDFKEIEYYQSVNQGEKGKYLVRKSSTNEFTIFGYDKKEFVKIYQPNALKDDKYTPKHNFVGEKEGKRIIYGWDRLFKKIDIDKINFFHQMLKVAKGKERSDILEALDEKKLDSVIIATGGSDGINLASLGFDVIWFNSEHEVITSNEYYELSKIAKKIYYVPDLDPTGVKQALQVAEKGLGIHLVWLPKELIYQKKKDFSDWIRREKNAGIEVITAIFKKMLERSLNFQFWDTSEKGNCRINSLKVLHFLECQQFFHYKSPFLTKEKENEGEFVFVDNHKICKVSPSDIRSFVKKWSYERFIGNEVQEKLMFSPVFNIPQLKMLPIFEQKIVNNTQGAQFYFFENTGVKITKEGIEKVEYHKNKEVFFWENDIKKHRFEVEEPFFEVYSDEQNRQRIKILRKESNYLKVLINTSRIFWQKDADQDEKDLFPFEIGSKNLSDEETFLQETHLLNKMYCVGYLLHQYKSESKGFMVVGTDYKGGASVRGSYGGTGKSFLIKGLFSLLPHKEIGGKTLDTNNFAYDGITEKTKLVLLDDLLPHQKVEDFFNKTTGVFEANHKGGAIYNIPFEHSPKMAATTNFVPNLEDGSASRRMLFYQNSDYYHAKAVNTDYVFSRKIADDFGGRNIMNAESSVLEWNADYNFMFQCLQFYLSQTQEVKAPLDSLMERRHLLKVGDAFIAFFKEFFADNQNLNAWIENSVLTSEAQELFGKSKYSTQEINKKLADFCSANHWTLERKKLKNNLGNSVNHFYIKTETENTEKSPLSEDLEDKKPQNDNLLDDIAF